MELCHPRCVEILKRFVGSVVPRSLFRALDVAGGDGRLCTSLLLKSYRRVDLFDQCPEAVKKAKRILLRHERGGNVTQATMQAFQFSFDYSAIFMIWCAGYLGRSELVSFLRRAKTRLIVDSGRMSRRTMPESFIFLLDNVLTIGEEAMIIKGQQVRTERELEVIFAEAGLLVHKRTQRETMPAGFRNVVVWALY